MLFRKSLIFVTVLCAVIFADDELLGLKINAWGWLTFGKVGSGYASPDPEFDLNFTKMWLSDYNAGLRVEKEFSENFKARIHFGISTAYVNADPRLPSQEYQQRRFAAYLIDALMERTFALNEQQSLKLEFGYMPVRYNPQASNLGEYLFRSTPYPTVIESGFELADKEKITGIHVGYQLKFLEKSCIKVDEYLFTSMRVFPNFDISEALLFSINTEQFFELGAGVVAHNFLSVDGRKTTPGSDPNVLRTFPEKHVHIASNGAGGYDTTRYTFSGTKLMTRFTFNPRTWIPLEILGPEDLKIYGELAVLGVKNYDGWFENMNERIPRMIGFNFPAFKVLDVLSLELQYFPNKYWNSWENVWKAGSVVPYQGRLSTISYQEWISDTTAGTAPVTEDDWKWSIYMSKKIMNRVRLSLQFADDNLFKSKYMPPPPSQSKYTEVMRHTWMTDVEGNEKWGMVKDWYWMARITFYL